MAISIKRELCAWCDKKKHIRHIGRTPTDIRVPVCSIPCAQQWNRWERNGRRMQAVFDTIPVDVLTKLSLDDIDYR